ncbi:MAG: restriction endonuclease [Caldilineaceae bacterium]
MGLHINFGSITPEAFEFMCEELLKAQGFVIDVRPSRGPDQGKDIIALRDITDNIGLTYKEIWLIECKHTAKSNRSVTESDIGNFETRMKLHGANRYLLVTSTTISETVKNQLKAVTEDPSSPRMAIFWSRYDLARFLEGNDSIVNRYFKTWNSQANEAAALLCSHHYSAHRGAVLWCPKVTCIFEHRNATKEAIEGVKELLLQEKFEILALGKSERSDSWVLLVNSSEAERLNELVWSRYPTEAGYTIYQRQIAFDRIWQFFYQPINEAC